MSESGRLLRVPGAAIGVLLLVLAPTASAGQEPAGDPDRPALEPGRRVEVWSPLLVDRRGSGRLESLGRDSIVFREGDGSVRRIPLSTVRRLHVATGPRPSTLRGALLGTVAGIAAAIAYDEATGERQEGGGGLVEPRWGLRAGIIAAGAGAGAVVGWRIRVPRWEDVPVPGSAGRAGGSGGERSYLPDRF